MEHASQRRVRRSRFAALSVAIALLGGVVTSCFPDPGSPGLTPAEKFCEFWDKVDEAPPSTDAAVLVKDDVVALAADTTVTGNECTDANAKVKLDGAVLAEGEEIESKQDQSDGKVAAITGDEVGAGEPVLDNLKVQTLSAEIGVNGITLKGNVAVTLSGVTSTIGFVGTLASLDNWSINLSSAGLTIPGVTTSPVVFNGTLKVTNGVPSLSMTALASAVKIGDISVTGATVKLDASPVTGVSASVSGAVKIGPSTASGFVDITFDKAGALVAANAEIDAHLVGSMAGGKKIDLTGSVTFVGNADQTAITFKGSGIVGDLLVHEASGDLTLQNNKATFNGKLDVASGPNFLRYNGTIIWENGLAYTPFLMLEGAGEFSGTMADGSTVSVKGTMSTEVVGTQLRAVVTGDFKIGTLKATGKAIVESNGSTTNLLVDADLVDAGFAARLEGAVIITDGVIEQVHLDAAINGSISFGDLTLNGATFSLRSTWGSPIDISFDGGLKVGTQADLAGSVKASFGPNGSLLKLEGHLTGSLLLDSWGIVNFNGSVLASSEQVALSGQGGVYMTNFPLGINFKGTFVSSLTQPSFTLIGEGRFRIASIDVASARLSLSQGVGMKATRVGFYFNIIGIGTYFEADFYMKPTGGCSKVTITAGNIIARAILKGILPGVVGCPVT